MIRDGKKLAKFSDNQLAAMVASCIFLGVDEEEIARIEDAYRSARLGRAMVCKAAAAYDCLEHMKTVAHVISASDESRAWSDMEGGHRFFERPVVSVDMLICGYLDKAVSGPGRFVEVSR